MIAPRGRLFNYGCRSGKSIRPDRLIHKLETILQSNPRGAAHACSGNSFRGGVSSRFTRRPKGQSTVEYVLIVTIIVLVILIAGPWVSSAVRNQFNLVAGAIGSGTTGENFYEPVDIPDPENGTAFAVYSEDDHSLMFYKRRGVPKVGDMFNYRRVTAVYTGFETEIYGVKNSDNYIPWELIANKVTIATVIDEGVTPLSIAHWFDYFYNMRSCNLGKLNAEKVASLHGTFYQNYSLSNAVMPLVGFPSLSDMQAAFESCHSLTSLDFNGSDIANVQTLNRTFKGCERLVIDCSNWNVSNVIDHDGFNASAPAVILPKVWQ